MTIQEAFNLSIGAAVAASTPNGCIVEGNVVTIIFYDKDCTIVIKDHDFKEISHWRAEYVERV